MSHLAILQTMLVSMYENTLAVPELIVLPPRAFDPLMTELSAKGYKVEQRPGAFGFWEAGQIPHIELNTTDGSVVRIERGRDPALTGGVTNE